MLRTLLLAALLGACCAQQSPAPARATGLPRMPSLSSLFGGSGSSRTAAAGSAKNAYEALRARNLTLFARIAEIGGLDPFLESNKTRITIFAPTNAAIQKVLTALKSNPEAFAQSHNMLLIDRILAQHIVLEGGNVASRNIRNGQTLRTALNDTVTANVRTGGLMRSSTISIKGPQNSATVTQPDIKAGNVVIHVIDTVLLPPRVFLTIEAALSARNITSTLLKLLKADPALAKAIADPTTNVTLFAPANKAIDPVLADPALQSVVSDPKAVSKILAYHAAKGARIMPPFEGRNETLPTLLAGQSLTIDKVVRPRAGSLVGTVTVTADSAGAKPAAIRYHNVVAGASLINVIDGVLIPKL